MAITAAAIAGGLGLAGGIFGDTTAANSAQATNQMTMQLQGQAENWMANMSDTAMQRRVTDLKAAGLNPLLAVGEGGASTPSIGTPGLQNPGSAFGNLGGQVTGAVGAATNAYAAAKQGSVQDTQASVNTTQAASNAATAAKTMIDAQNAAGVDVDVKRNTIATGLAQQEALKAQAGQSNASAALSNAQVQVAQASLPKIKAEIAAIAASQASTEAQTHLTNLQGELAKLNNAQFALISPEVVNTAIENARNAKNQAMLSQLQLPQAEAESNMWARHPSTSYMNTIMNWFHIGAQVH